MLPQPADPPWLLYRAIHNYYMVHPFRPLVQLPFPIIPHSLYQSKLRQCFVTLCRVLWHERVADVQ
jgi:hypothetical protein